MNDLDVAHPTYFAAKIYLKVNFQIAFTIKLRTWRVQIIQRTKQKKTLSNQIENLHLARTIKNLSKGECEKRTFVWKDLRNFALVFRIERIGFVSKRSH